MIHEVKSKTTQAMSNILLPRIKSCHYTDIIELKPVEVLIISLISFLTYFTITNKDKNDR